MDDKAPQIGDDLPPRKKQWLWFLGLWLGGLLAVLLLSAAVKLLFKFS
jgi:hypothetical protein